MVTTVGREEFVLQKKYEDCAKWGQGGRVLWLTLNRPRIHNAFDDRLIAAIAKAFRDDASGDKTLRAVVLAGAGKSFCAGADLNWMKRMVDFSQEQNYRDSQGLAEMMEAIQSCPIPVVARVHGVALGGGVGLVAACDYVLMGEWVSWGLTEVNLGLIPAVVGPAVIEKNRSGSGKGGLSQWLNILR